MKFEEWLASIEDDWPDTMEEMAHEAWHYVLSQLSDLPDEWREEGKDLRFHGQYRIASNRRATELSDRIERLKE